MNNEGRTDVSSTTSNDAGMILRRATANLLNHRNTTTSSSSTSISSNPLLKKNNISLSSSTLPVSVVDKISPSRNDSAWLISFTGAMIPFVSFCYAHQRGTTVRVLERVAKSRFGVYGFLALPFVTLSMEKCIYDTLQSIQGVDPKHVPNNRGGFPSGGGTLLPSFSLVPVMKQTEENESVE